MYNKFIKKDGEVLLDLTKDTVESSMILEGVTAHNKSGEKITGTFTLDNELTAQDNLIAQIQAAVDSLPEAGGEPSLQTKTVTPTTSSQNVTPDSGYDGLSKVTINAIPSTYMKPSTIKFATTFTPTTSNQTIAAGTYCYGAQTIKGDANLVAENIAEGVSIFGVTGTHSGGSGGGSVVNGVFTITETMGDEPGLYVYTLASTELYSSSRLFIEIYYVDKSGYNHFTAYVFSRSNTTEAFTVRKGSSGDMNFGSANSLTLNENTLIGSGNIVSGTTVYFTAI